MGDASLRVIAHELVKSVKADASVDWPRFESVRARLRVNVKRILRKYGYPPDLQDAAVAAAPVSKVTAGLISFSSMP